MELIITPPEEMKKMMKNVLQEFEEEKKKKEKIPKLYTINQVAKKLGKAHSTIKKYVDNGMIKTSKNGNIPEDAINEFLERSL